MISSNILVLLPLMFCIKLHVHVFVFKPFLETLRKLMIKILNTRLGKIFSTHSILQPSQFASLPGSSTMSPISVAKQLIDNARTNNKELWLYLQDLSKCYDRVDTRILRHAMHRLKIPSGFINLAIDLFTNRRN